MQNKPFISIVIPSFNPGRLLVRALESIIDNNTPLEVIVVDDGSTDSSLDLAKEFTDKCSKHAIKYISNDISKGPGAARNKGIKLAEGDYIVFCDADDFFKEGAIDFLASKIKVNQDIDIFVFGYEAKKSNRKAIIAEKNEMLLVDRDSIIEKFLSDETVSAPWAKAISSEIAKKFEFPNLFSSEDAIFNLNVFNQARSCLILNEPLYVFDQTLSGSLTRKKFNIEQARICIEGWSHFVTLAQELGVTKTHKRSMAAREIMFMSFYFTSRIFPFYRDDNLYKPPKEVAEAICSSSRKNIILAIPKLKFKQIIFALACAISAESAIKLYTWRHGTHD